MNTEERMNLINIVHTSLKRDITLGKTPLHFVKKNVFSIQRGKSVDLATLEKRFKELLDIEKEDIMWLTPFKYPETSIQYKVRMLLYGASIYSTYNRWGTFQCRENASRSATDLWRLYKHYFPNEKIDIIDIMKVLHYLGEDFIGGQYCPNVKRQVFWDRSGDEAEIYDTDSENELGVSFFLWEYLYI